MLGACKGIAGQACCRTCRPWAAITACYASAETEIASSESAGEVQARHAAEPADLEQP